MSVRIFYKDGTNKNFITEKCVYDQLDNAKSVEIDTKDPYDAELFLGAVCNKLSILTLPPLDIKIKHNDTIQGIRLARQSKQIFNKNLKKWIVKEIVKNQNYLESKLEDIIKYIKENRNAEKSA